MMKGFWLTAQCLSWVLVCRSGWGAPLRADAGEGHRFDAPASHGAVAGGQERSGPPATKGLEYRERIALAVYGDRELVPLERLRNSLEQDLGAPVELATSPLERQALPRLTVRYVNATREVVVSYVDPEGRAATRVATAPQNEDELVALVVALAANLSRDEVSELLGPAEMAAAPPPAAPSPQVPPAPPKASVPAEPTAVEPAPRHTIGAASVFFPLATNAWEPDIRTNASFNLIYGRVGGVDGIQLGTVNVVTEPLAGLQIGVLGNAVTGETQGIQLAGLGNVAQGSAQALQVALLGNVSSEGIRGAQLGGIANLSGGYSHGLQATLGANLASGAVSGIQAGFFGPNYAGGRLDGIQVAGIANVTGKPLRGLQATAGLNLADDVSGVQVGLINVAKKVRGVQVGLVNVAEDVEGVPVGLFSVTRSGGVRVAFWSSTAAYGNVGLKLSTRYTYTQLSLSGHKRPDGYLLGPGLALGGTVPTFERGYVDINLGATHLFADTPCCEGTRFLGAVPRREDRTQFHLRAAPRYAVAKHFSVFAGVGLIGRLTYPLDGNDDAAGEYIAAQSDDQGSSLSGDTRVAFTLLPEGFAGIEL